MEETEEAVRKETRKVVQTTWKAYHGEIHGRLSTEEIDLLPKTCFAFPRVRKAPMPDAAHVRDAIARFDQVSYVTDEERDLAFANIQKAARHFRIKLNETSWHELVSRVERNR